MNVLELELTHITTEFVTGTRRQPWLIPFALLISLLAHLTFFAIGIHLISAPLPKKEEVVFVELIDAGVVQEAPKGDSAASLNNPEAPAVPEPLPPPPPAEVKPQEPPAKFKQKSILPPKPVFSPKPKSVAQPQLSQTKTDSETSEQAGAENYPAINASASDSGPGGKSPRSNGGNQDSAYAALLISRLNAFKEYPLMARKRGLEGQVLVRLVLERDGTLRRSAMDKSSGFRELDDGALRLVQTAAPYPPVPHSLEGMLFEFLLPITYALH